MAISRRTLLADGAVILGAGRYAWSSDLRFSELWSDDFPPVELDFPDVELDPELPLVVGANTSGYNTCHVQVLDPQWKKILWQSKEWATEPNKSNSAGTTRLGGSPEKKHTVQAVMRPTRAGTPSMAVAIHQGSDLDKSQIEMLAEKARFVTDPAQYPEGGHFEVNLYLDSTVKVQIWTGTIAKGTPVLENQFHNVQAGRNRVPWDLKIRGGKVAPSGRYVAVLTCTPNQSGKLPTFLGSSFGVA
jgi:hypothetical protein